VTVTVTVFRGSGTAGCGRCPADAGQSRTSADDVAACLPLQLGGTVKPVGLCDGHGLPPRRAGRSRDPRADLDRAWRWPWTPPSGIGHRGPVAHRTPRARARHVRPVPDSVGDLHPAPCQRWRPCATGSERHAGGVPRFVINSVANAQEPATL